MTQAEYNAALSGLSRALGLGDEADTARLTDVLCAAEESILRYLKNCPAVPRVCSLSWRR